MYINRTPPSRWPTFRSDKTRPRAAHKSLPMARLRRRRPCANNNGALQYLYLLITSIERVRVVQPDRMESISVRKCVCTTGCVDVSCTRTVVGGREDCVIYHDTRIAAHLPPPPLYGYRSRRSARFFALWRTTPLPLSIVPVSFCEWGSVPFGSCVYIHRDNGELETIELKQ